MIPRRLLFALLCLAATKLSAAPLELPADARLVAESEEPLATLRLPAGPWQAVGFEVLEFDGSVSRQAWQIPVTGLSTAQLVQPLRDQLAAAGFEILFECAARDCGGFEFRYEMNLLPEPAMHVDLGDYRYLLVRRLMGELGEHVALLVSRASDRGFIHITSIAPLLQGADSIAVEATDRALRPKPRFSPDATVPSLPLPVDRPLLQQGELARALDSSGHAVLSDLSFETGSSRLSGSSFQSLADLAAWFGLHPQASIVLVGHTDTKGSLAGNIELSRKRAAAVRERLSERHGIPTDRMAADGVGYLAPIASNTTEAGRTLNRRVEVVLASDG